MTTKRSRRKGSTVRNKVQPPVADPATPAAPTSWDPVAKWYKKWAGAEGSEHHKRLAIPAAMDLLGPLKGSSVLDIGCGTGVLARHVTSRGAAYVGVDASPKLLEFARGHAAPGAAFYLGDASSLASIPQIKPESFDAAIFMLSIQDMSPLSDILKSAAWALKPRGRMVIVMTHPCFRVPRQSGWGWDEGRKLTYRRVDRYMTPLSVPVRPVAKEGAPSALTSFHRPIQDYVNGLAELGLLIDRLLEIPPDEDVVASRPRKRRRTAQRPVNVEIPVFLCLRAWKLGEAGGLPVGSSS